MIKLILLFMVGACLDPELRGDGSGPKEPKDCCLLYVNQAAGGDPREAIERCLSHITMYPGDCAHTRCFPDNACYVSCWPTDAGEEAWPKDCPME